MRLAVLPFVQAATEVVMFIRTVAAAATVLLLAACASTGGQHGAFDQLPLYGADGRARFAFYYSCAGSVSQETELCSAPASDFSAWADERHVPLKRVPKDDFDERSGVAAGKLSSRDKDLPYRVFVGFAPVALASVQWALTTDVKGGYTPPKAGYVADVFVYDVASGKLAAQTHLSNKVDAKGQSDPTPYVHEGAAAVLAALAPHPAAPSTANH